MSPLFRFCLLTVLCVLLPVQISLAADEAETPRYQWRLVSAWPPNFPVFETALKQFVDDVAVMSQNRLQIKLYPAGKLVPAFESFDAVSQGVVEMAHGTPYYWAGKVPAVQFISAVPFGMNTRDMDTWLYQGGGLALWQALYTDHHLVVFPAGNSGVQMGGWFRKKITSIDDFKGLKMRIPGLGGQVLAKAGATPILIPPGEIYTALERGVIDATEWVGPFHDARQGLYRAAPYYYYPGWHEPSAVLELLINQAHWDKLSPDLQRIIAVAARKLHDEIYTQFEYANMTALQELRNNPKVDILPFPPEVLTELHRLTKETLTEISAKNPDFAKLYQAYQDFRNLSTDWTHISEQAYQQTMMQIEAATP